MLPIAPLIIPHIARRYSCAFGARTVALGCICAIKSINCCETSLPAASGGGDANGAHCGAVTVPVGPPNRRDVKKMPSPVKN